MPKSDYRFFSSFSRVCSSAPTVQDGAPAACLMEAAALEEVQNCAVKLRSNPQRHRNKVYVGCGAGFGGDRPIASLKLLERVEELNYIVLECLAERTLADCYRLMMSGGKGFDPRVKKWLSVLLPLALDREVCIITNMGAIDPPGAQKEILDLASDLGLEITVAIAYESPISHSGSSVLSNESIGVGQLAQGTLASHLLECGCQLTGGYFMHPGDVYREFSFEQLLDLSLPYAEVSYKGEVCVGKAKGSGGLLSYSTCAEQLLYEVGDPANYITPDLVVDFSDVQFHQISIDKVHCKGAKPSHPCRPEKLLQLFPTECGWKGWGEISYGGQECLRRAQAAEYLVRSWMDERYPGIDEKIVAYIIGYDSLKAIGGNKDSSSAKEVIDARLRMDGLFDQEEHADGFVQEFIALYTNGPAGGGGISTGQKKEVILQKLLIDREDIFWQVNVKNSIIPSSVNRSTNVKGQVRTLHEKKHAGSFATGIQHLNTNLGEPLSPVSAPSGTEIALYRVAHGRAGDKGNDLNVSVIPHFPEVIGRLRTVITPVWVKNVVSPLLDFFFVSK
uniref:Uncharacterized protein n=1 Tax=Avena sativa TaxID=4498 RepID=A0ACD5UZ95_AVESA